MFVWQQSEPTPARPEIGRSFSRLANSSRRRRKLLRRGAAAVELALLLPLLMLLFVLAADFSRVYYCSLTVTNCARAGAIYASDPTAAPESPFANVTAAALADASNLSPQPTVDALVYGSDALGQPYVEVTVRYPFSTISGYLGSVGNLTLVRTVRAPVAPVSPSN